MSLLTRLQIKPTIQSEFSYCERVLQSAVLQKDNMLNKPFSKIRLTIIQLNVENLVVQYKKKIRTPHLYAPPTHIRINLLSLSSSKYRAHFELAWPLSKSKTQMLLSYHTLSVLKRTYTGSKDPLLNTVSTGYSTAESVLRL